MSRYQYFSDLPCHAPLKIAPPLPNATLLTLLLFIRHGMRSPALILHHPGNEGSWNCTGMKNNTKFPHVAVNGKPYQYYEYDPTKKYVFPPSCQRSALVDEGITKIKEIGKLYYNYSLMYNLISPETDPHKALSMFSVRSSNAQRCIESGISFLNGFFNNYDGTFNETLEMDVGEEGKEPLAPSPFRNKLIFEQILKFIDQDDYRKRYVESEEIVQKFSKYLKIIYPVHEFESLTMGDFFNSVRCANQEEEMYRTPEHEDPSEEVLITPEMHRILMNNVFYLEGKFYNYSLPLPAGPILKLVVEKLDKIESEKPEKIFNLFSSHSETLSALIATFGIDCELPPPFNSHLLLEVWKPDDSSPIIIRFVLNGDQLKIVPLEDFMKNAMGIIKEYEKQVNKNDDL